MNAIQLLKPNNEPANAWMCECGRFWIDQNGAGRCCACSYCGEKTKPNEFHHSECYRKHYEALQAERLEKATKLESWNGWVYFEGLGHNEGFFESLGELIKVAANEDCELPDFVFVCHENPFSGVDIDDAIENATCDMYEDAADDLKGIKELRAAVKEFNEKNASLMSYSIDYKRAVRVPKQQAAT